MGIMNYDLGEEFEFEGQPVIIRRIDDIDTVTVEFVMSNNFAKVHVGELRKVGKNIPDKQPNIQLLSDAAYLKAKERYEIIKPILANPSNYQVVKALADEHNLHPSTLYRWLDKFRSDGAISSLSNKKREVIKSRIGEEKEEIISRLINTVYMKPGGKSIQGLIKAINAECFRKKIKPPSDNSIIKRLKKISDYESTSRKVSVKKARELYGPKLGKLEAEMPYDIVQIDHTPLDIILVDEINRIPFKRPYLTLAIDVFSRMVVGFYLSFDPPGTLAAGQCVASAILPKEKWLAKYSVDAKWPCWGVMNTLHMDNAKEFRSDSFKRSCNEYRINIEYRPVKTPHFGGHIERLLGTFAKEIHDLPGTTFSNPLFRKDYNSEKMAAMTISELEEWLLIFITKIYHLRVHSKLGTSPIEKYRSAFTYDGSEKPAVVRHRFTDEERIKLDFLPHIERSVQNYGVVINNITYFDEVLTTLIKNNDGNKRKKFFFRTDPRDISKIYYYSEQLSKYFEVRYWNTGLPSMSIWEYREVVSRLKAKNIPVNESEIFKAYDELVEIEKKAIQERKKLNRVSKKADKRQVQAPEVENENTDSFIEDFEDLKPFDDITRI